MSLPLPPGKKLAVPPMLPGVTPSERAQVLALVKRHQFGAAYDLACDLNAMHSRSIERAMDLKVENTKYEQHLAA